MMEYGREVTGGNYYSKNSVSQIENFYGEQISPQLLPMIRILNDPVGMRNTEKVHSKKGSLSPLR